MSDAPSPPPGFTRLHRNLGHYCGESIDIHSVVGTIEKFAGEQGFASEVFLNSNGLRLLGLHRSGHSPAAQRVYISSGIHGDEPAAPLAVLGMFEKSAWPVDFALWICPCLNPTGFDRNQRENAQGQDLNRDYLSLETTEIQAHVRWLRGQPQFDFSICLHEDWEAGGFYLYELIRSAERSVAPRIVEAVARVCPVDYSEIIEGRAASRGVIRPMVDPQSRPDWPEAFYLTTHKTPLSYTLEAPSDFPLNVRVAGLEAALCEIFRISRSG